MPDTITTVNEFANAVADYLEEYGHCQTGGYYGPYLDGKYQRSACVRGAADKVDGVGVYSIMSDVEREFLSAVIQAVDDTIPRWSDSTPTSEVIATLRSLS